MPAVRKAFSCLGASRASAAVRVESSVIQAFEKPGQKPPKLHLRKVCRISSASGRYRICRIKNVAAASESSWGNPAATPTYDASQARCSCFGRGASDLNFALVMAGMASFRRLRNPLRRNQRLISPSPVPAYRECRLLGYRAIYYEFRCIILRLWKCSHIDSNRTLHV